MHYDPRDPKTYAFYQMFIADEDDRKPVSAPGCSGCLGVVVVLFAVMVIAATFR